MAIDNAEKRRSISGIQGLIPGVTPNASKDGEWRQQSGWSYSGISPIAVILQVSCTLVNRTGAELPNLTSLSWAWFDAADPNSFGAPSDQGQTETTDGNAELVIPLPNTTLSAGQSGTLVLMSDDSLTLGAYILAVAAP